MHAIHERIQRLNVHFTEAVESALHEWLTGSAAGTSDDIGLGARDKTKENDSEHSLEMQKNAVRGESDVKRHSVCVHCVCGLWLVVGWFMQRT
jgi:hypothetical protein